MARHARGRGGGMLAEMKARALIDQAVAEVAPPLL